MSYKITITYQGDIQNHIANPLNCLDGREYATREEACEAIYLRMYDVIDSETGCEMVDRQTDEINCDDDETSNARQSAYIDACHAYILRDGYATEDGVSATVEESANA